MSTKYPIIAVTGSSGAGTTTVKNAFEHIFRREGIKAAIVEGDSFHRYDRQQMKEAMAKAGEEHRTGQKRYYLHNEEEAAPYNQEPGTFTPWEPIEPGSDLLFYEGLHGGVVTDDADVAQWVDLLVGVVPIVNLEWIQKIQRDTAQRGYSAEAVTDTILRRMPDYVKTITPQFSRTDINFQRVPVVDTSNPFIARDIPTTDESFVVIRFRYPTRHDLSYYLQMLNGSWMSRYNTLVLPGGKMSLAMEVVLNPIIHDLIAKKRAID